MKIYSKSLAIVLLLLTFCTATAQEKWVKLFNGKDLNGWKQLGGKATYEVKDGQIIGTTVPDEPNSFLTTT